LKYNDYMKNLDLLTRTTTTTIYIYIIY